MNGPFGRKNYLMTPDILARRREADKQGLSPGPAVPAHLSRPLPPPIWPALAGLPPNKIGGTVRIDSTQFNTSQGNGVPGFSPQTVIVEARNPTSDAEPICVTLGFELSFPLFGMPTPLTDFDSRCTATIDWGVGNASYNAEVDFCNGLVLGLSASYVRVTANVPDNVANANNRHPLFYLSAGLSAGVPPQTRNRARLTVPLTDADNQQTIAIPNFATGITLLTVPGTLSGPFIIHQSDAGPNPFTGLVRYQHIYQDATNNSGQATGFFPIGNGADVVTVVNTAVGGTVEDVAVVFEISL